MKSRTAIRFWQVGVLLIVIVLWYVLTSPTLLPPFYFTNANQAAFFFGEPLEVGERIWTWFVSGEIYLHLGVTLLETVLAFVFGTLAGLAIGMWLALAPAAAAVFDPYIKGANAIVATRGRTMPASSLDTSSSELKRSSMTSTDRRMLETIALPSAGSDCS